MNIGCGSHAGGADHDYVIQHYVGFSVCLMQLHTHLLPNLAMNVCSVVHMQIMGHT